MNDVIVANGKLPVSYVAAKKALSECARVDECQEWANKAAALSSYARQAKDESLRRMADRIQARATRRCGELLKQVPPGVSGRAALTSELPTRKQAAEDAGLSRHQKNVALNMANIPAETFEAAVESESPPTITDLAQMGVIRMPTVHPNLPDASPIRKFARFCGSTDAASFAASVTDLEMKKELTALIGEIDSWLDQFVTTL